jgi:thioesterase domain-containing protein/acyl carrier protein
MRYPTIDAPPKVNGTMHALEETDVFVFPTTVAQRGFWYLDGLDPGNPAYNIAVRFRLEGPLNQGALARAINEIIRRHESLRTAIKEVDGEPVQVVMPSLSIPLPVADLRSVPAADRHQRSEAMATEEARKRFDLSAGPLVRAGLLRLDEQDQVLLVTVHHIISDGWSIGVITRELGALYDAYCRGLDSPLDDLPLQYGDFAVWQERWLASSDLGGQLAYWTRRLSRLPLLEIAPDRPRPATWTSNGHIESTVLSRGLTTTLEEWARGRGHTFFMLAAAVLKVLIGRETGREDVFVGTLTAGRSRVELEPLIGPFINPLVLWTDLSGDPPFPELLTRVGETVIEALANQQVPFERVVQAIQPRRDPARHPVFQINFIYQRDFVRPVEAGGLSLTAIPSRSPGSIYDLNFFMVERADGWRASCEYNTDLYEPATVVRLLARFRTLLEGVAADPERRISQLPAKSAADREPEAAAAGSSPGSSRLSRPADAGPYVAPRDEIEARLARLWEDLLASDRISVTADFFDEGGHSLLAAKLIAQIERSFGKRLSLATLLQVPTIRSLAEHLRSERLTALRRQVFSLRAGGSQPPFLVQTSHPNTWRLLMRHLDPGQPLHGILLPEAISENDGPSVEELASNLVEAVREAVPNGPYYLGGWCRSGIIAYEMAQQLRARGEEVALVVLVDSYSPPYELSFRGLRALPIRLYFLAVKFCYYLAGIRDGQAGVIVDFIKRRMRSASESFRTRLGNWWSHGRDPRSPEVAEHPELSQYRLTDRYAPRPYTGRVVLFRTARFQTGRFRDPTLGWGELVGGGLEVHELPGNHHGVFQEPVVAMLARKLSPYLPRPAGPTDPRPLHSE